MAFCCAVTTHAILPCIWKHSLKVYKCCPRLPSSRPSVIATLYEKGGAFELGLHPVQGIGAEFPVELLRLRLPAVGPRPLVRQRRRRREEPVGQAVLCQVPHASYERKYANKCRRFKKLLFFRRLTCIKVRPGEHLGAKIGETTAGPRTYT